MRRLSESFLRVNYSLRPAKQVERRMLVDAFHLLSEAGFHVRDYQYTGMGSIHFADFSLFHKFLGIEKMLSVERSPKIEKRVQFNVPFRTIIRVETGQPIGDFIANLSDKDKHVLWLDYDNVLSEDMLKDVVLAAGQLPRGSILLVTVDTEQPGVIRDGKSKQGAGPENNLAYFKLVARQFLEPMGDPSLYEYGKLPRVNVRAIRAAIDTGVSGRDVAFMPLFSFVYADGHRMLTLGGIMVSGSDKRRVRRSRLAKMEYARFNWDEEPYDIVVPNLTRKEIMHLESHMPCETGWTPREFELSRTEVAQYRRIYRFFPTYAELLL